MVRRDRAAILVTLTLAVLIEAVALRAHTLGVVLLGVIAAMAAIAFATRADLGKVGLGATYASAFTLTWNGWFLGPVRPGDALVLVALLCFAAGAPMSVFRTPPWWIKQLAFALIALVVLIALFPPSEQYLIHRVVLNAGGQPIPFKHKNIPMASMGVAVKFIIGVAAIPVAYTAAAMLDRRAPKWLAICFVTGSSLSGAVAFIAHVGIADIGHYLTHLPAGASARQVGFSYHPNFLAAGLVLAIPFACWLLTSHNVWEKRLGAICLLADLLGVYASGSRGGAVCSVGAVVLAFALLPRTRPHLPGILAAALCGVGIVMAAFPSFGLKVLRVTRLVGNPTAAGSDQVRAMVGAQGVRDFHHAPIHGIGLQASFDASQVYLQELASGGLILFCAMSAYVIGASWTSFRFMNREPLAAAVLGAIGATLALNIFEADLTDRFYYVPEAVLVALVALHKTQQRQEPDEPAPARHALAKASR